MDSVQSKTSDPVTKWWAGRSRHSRRQQVKKSGSQASSGRAALDEWTEIVWDFEESELSHMSVG
jgi:hypothetical protein